MNLPTRDDLRTLASTADSSCVSIYMPTHRTGRDLRQDPIRLKNLLVQAQERLEKRGMRSSDARDMLQPARQFLSDEPFWRRLGDGLAVFLTRTAFRHYSLPLAFQEQAVVNSRYYLKPMLPLLSGDGMYYVVMLSQSNVQLFEGSRYSIREVDLEKVPQSLGDVLKFYDLERQHQSHIRAPRGGSREAMFHGHGAGNVDQKDFLLQYFRQVDKGMHDFLRTKNVPLVLAGVEYYLPIYKEANTYAHLMDKVIAGNHQQDNMGELHRQSWKIVEPVFTKPRQLAFDQFQQLAGTDKATTKLGKILPSAFQGRIATLLVSSDKQRWGKFDRGTQQIITQENKEAESEDLYDLAAVQTFLSGGSVYVVEQANGVLQDSAVAAIFRY